MECHRGVTESRATMFHVEDNWDAWELGVLVQAGLLWDTDPVNLGVRAEDVEEFQNGRKDMPMMAQDHIDRIAQRWSVVKGD